MNALRLYYFFVFAMYAVVIPHYQVFLRASGYEPLALGIMIGFFEISGVVGPMLLARLADRTGRFREIKAGTTLLAGGVMVFLLMELPFLAAVLISGLTGFLFKVSVPLTDAVAGSVLSDPREQYGKVRVFGSIGFAVAAVLVPAGNLLDQESPESMMIAFLVAMALFAAAVILVRPPASQKSATSAGTQTPGKAKRLEPIFWAVLAAVGLGNIAFGAYNSFFSLYLKEDLGVEAVTVYWAIGAVSEIPIIF
ncbi:MAG: MFS transporter, partial [Alkalispirochaetaceae bacterium]